MPVTATFDNRFTAVFTPPELSIMESGLPLLTELDAAIQTESSVDIVVDAVAGFVPVLTAHRIGLNSYRVSGTLST